MKITVRLFASAKDVFGFEERQVDVKTATLDGVMESLAALTPASAPLLQTCRFAVNRTYAARNAAVKDGDEVAVIPPVSGG